MKTKSLYLVITTILIVYVTGCSAGPVEPNSPENLLKLFNAALDANDEAKAEGVCTKEFWNEKRDSGRRFFKQVQRKKFQLDKNEARTKGERAVLIIDVIRDGKAVDQVYFYTVNKDQRWWIDGMDENRKHIDYFLDGRLPGRFYPADYNGSKELEELGAKCIEIAGPLQVAEADPAKQASLLKSVFNGDPNALFNQLRLLRKVGQLKLQVISTHWVDTINRGAIVIHDESGKEKVFLYVVKEDAGWKLVNCYTGWLSAESLL